MKLTKSIKTTIKNVKWLLVDKSRYERRDLVYRQRLEQNLSKKDIDKNIYIINRREKVGLFSYVETTLRYIAYAIEKGYIPYVDMKGIANSYVDDEQNDKVNMWDLYFKQPCIESVDSYPNKIYCKEEDMSNIPYRGDMSLKKSIYFWGSMYNSFLKLNEVSNTYFQKEYQQLFGNSGEGVLGVLIRGTDIVGAMGHAVQPTVDMVLERIHKHMKSGRYNRIYLATEEEKNEKLLKENFGADKVIVNKRVYYTEDQFREGQTINDIDFDRPNDKYLRGMEYLSSVMLLSKCEGFVGGICGGSLAACYINGGRYKNCEMIDLGIN